MSSSSEDSVQLPLKKRKPNPEKYNRNAVRNAKVKGLQYTNYKGKVIPARTTGSQCKCRGKCFEKFSQGELSFCIQTVSNFSTKNEQDIFFQQHIEKTPVRRHRARKEGAVLKEFSFIYHVSKPNKKIKVCKKPFGSIYGISEGRIRRICNLLLQSVTPRDKRGQHLKWNTKSSEVHKIIYEHILSFPRKKTHYAGKQIEYLDARLDIKTMHTLFKERHPNADVNYEYYAKYFKENFSLRFGRPQVDTCIRCKELSVKIKNQSLGLHAKRAAEAELAIHERRSKKFHNKISSVRDICQNREDAAILTFDFMQNLPLPCIPIQEIFYLRQLWVNCFGIKNLKTNQSVFYVYQEGQANKGANEVCSMLLHYFETFLPDNIQEVFLFSDNCPGQNKNHTMVRFLLSLTDKGRFSKLSHYFPIRGHSFLPNDRDFGVLKSKIKKHDRIYVPEEYYSLMTSAGTHFSVFELKTHQILNYSKCWHLHYKRNFLSNESLGRQVDKYLKNKRKHFLHRRLCRFNTISIKRVQW